MSCVRHSSLLADSLCIIVSVMDVVVIHSLEEAHYSEPYDDWIDLKIWELNWIDWFGNVGNFSPRYAQCPFWLTKKIRTTEVGNSTDQPKSLRKSVYNSLYMQLFIYICIIFIYINML